MIYEERKQLVMKVEDWYGLHKPYTLHLDPGYTCLVGPNGAGKTTLIKQLEQYFQKDPNVVVISHDNYHEGGSSHISKLCFQQRFEEVASTFGASEGQQITLSFGEFASEIGSTVRQNRSRDCSFLILLDAVDSGLSIDNVVEFLDLFNLICQDAGMDRTYIVCTANSYEMVRRAWCVDVRTGKGMRFSSYEAYAQFILDYHKKHELPTPANKKKGS